ncbi:MAG: glycosyltransferase family 2 protein [Candidatus Binatia bacterium]
MTPRAVDIVVPVRNEVDCIDELYARFERLGLADCLIFVDNASTDGTAQRLAACVQARVIRHTTDEGWGASVRDGIAASKAELLVIVDADLEYPPETVPAVLAALRDHPVVYGSRFLGPQPPDMPWLRRAGNGLMSAFYNRLFGQQVTDLATGLKGLRRGAIPLERLRRNGFEHGAEIAALIALSGHRIAEIAVPYAPRRRGRSKMRHLRVALTVVGLFVRYRLRGRID